MFRLGNVLIGFCLTLFGGVLLPSARAEDCDRIDFEKRRLRLVMLLDGAYRPNPFVVGTNGCRVYLDGVVNADATGGGSREREAAESACEQIMRSDGVERRYKNEHSPGASCVSEIRIRVHRASPGYVTRRVSPTEMESTIAHFTGKPGAIKVRNFGAAFVLEGVVGTERERERAAQICENLAGESDDEDCLNYVQATGN